MIEIMKILAQTVSFLCRIRIGSDSGIVYLVSQPSEYAPSRYEFEMIVTDGGGLSTTATLIVIFYAEFAVGPVFDSHIYNATVYENRTELVEPLRVRVSQTFL